MKRILLYIITSALWLLNPAFGQNDSIMVETELVEADYYHKKYQYLDINLSDEVEHIKFGVQPFKPNDNYGYAVLTFHFGYEFKVNKTIALVNEINMVYNWSSNSNSLNQQSYSFGARYYLLKKKQMIHQTSGNNCNGFYAYTGLGDLLSLISVKQEKTDFGYKELHRRLNVYLKPKVAIGYQQKLARNLYFDGNVFLTYNIDNSGNGYDPWGYGVTFLFGGILSFNQ